MEVFINNQTISVAENSSLFSLLLDKNLAEKKGIAVAVNNKVIPQSHWPAHTIFTHDKITIIHATQGG